jgi:aminoglycoside phosphotransferase (APT) family kinase protein
VVDYEPDLIRRLAAEGLPVAAMVGDSRSGPPASLAYMVYELLEGIPLSERFGALTAAARDRLARELVAMMTGLGRIRLASWGEPVTAWRAGSPSWEAFVAESFAEGLDALAAHRLVEPELIDRLARIGARLGELIDPEAQSLAWVDCSPENVLVSDRDRLAGVVDLESVLVGDPMVPLGACHARFGDDAYFQALVRAWPEAPAEEAWRRIYLLSILRALRVAAFGRRPLPTGYPRAPLLEVFLGLRAAAARLDPASGSEPAEETA